MPLLPRQASCQNWFFRYKLYHLPFWFVYHYLWWVLTSGDPFQVVRTLLVLPYTLKYSSYVVFQALAVYVNLYVLMPRYLEKSRFGTYLIGWLLSVALATLCVVGGYYASAYVSHRSLQELYGQSARFYFFLGNALPSTMASMTLAMSIKLAKNWVQTRQRQQVLEKEKLETELKFLRQQFNPHFLFNTINAIFFLIHKNPDQASASLARFSDLLRYQLYECNDVQIPLNKEMAYLTNFIDLEKLRQNKNVKVALSIEPEYIPPMAIAPFILIPFVENAFKHVSKHSDQPNWISIQVWVKQAQLRLEVVNSVAGRTTDKFVHGSGIGLANVQRRLDLLYPARYTLRVQPEVDQFKVSLALELDELVVAPVLQLA